MSTRRISALLGALALCGYAQAGEVRDVSNENCTYAGMKLDLGAMPNTPGKVNNVPEDFSGLVVCTDPQTKHVYETYTLVVGLREGDTKAFDRDNGRLAEVVPYVKGVRHGCVKRYDSRTGHEVMEFCVDHGEPAGLSKQFDRDSGRLTRIYWALKRGESGEHTDISFNGQGQPTSLRCGPQTLMGADDLWCGRGGREGQVTLYADEGWPSQVVSYKNGVEHGWTRHYHRDGHLMREERYENGKSVEERANSDTGAKYERTKSGEIEHEVVYFEETKKPRLVVDRAKGHLSKEAAFYANGKPHYEKVWDGRVYRVREWADDGSLEREGVYAARWGDGLGLWGLGAVGAVKYFREGALLVETNSDDHFEFDGLQRTYDPKDPKRLQRREKYQHGRLLWSEDLMKNGDVRRRSYAEDGSVSLESVTKATTEL